VPVEHVAVRLNHPDHPGPQCRVTGGGHQLAHYLPAGALLPASLNLVVTGVGEPLQRRLPWAARTVEGCGLVGQGRGLLPCVDGIESDRLADAAAALQPHRPTCDSSRRRPVSEPEVLSRAENGERARALIQLRGSRRGQDRRSLG